MDNFDRLLKTLGILVAGTATMAGGGIIINQATGSHICIAVLGCNRHDPIPPSAPPISKSPDSSPPIVASPSAILPPRGSFCPLDKKTFVAAETDNFIVSICGNDHPDTYIGVSKNGGSSLSRPLSDAQPDRFLARNGSTSYILTRQSLTVTENGKILHSEKIQSYK
jgi:hypothetical protein